jgi:hypothetical protein
MKNRIAHLLPSASPAPVPAPLDVARALAASARSLETLREFRAAELWKKRPLVADVVLTETLVHVFTAPNAWHFAPRHPATALTQFTQFTQALVIGRNAFPAPPAAIRVTLRADNPCHDGALARFLETDRIDDVPPEITDAPLVWYPSDMEDGSSHPGTRSTLVVCNPEFDEDRAPDGDPTVRRTLTTYLNTMCDDVISLSVASEWSFPHWLGGTWDTLAPVLLVVQLDALDSLDSVDGEQRRA